MAVLSETVQHAVDIVLTYISNVIIGEFVPSICAYPFKHSAIFYTILPSVLYSITAACRCPARQIIVISCF